MDLIKRPACGNLACRRGGDLGSQGVTFLGQRAFPLTERHDLVFGAGRPLLGDRRRGLGARAAVLGIAARRVQGAGFLGQAVAPGP
jgi:hypothetical protein